MKKGYTHIVMIIDRSGSMSGLKSDVVGGFNDFVDEQRKAEGTATMTLIQFDTTYAVNYEFKDIQDVPYIDYSTQGCTAMYDAIGKAINNTGVHLLKMAEEDRPEKVIVIIQTDGEENSSKEYTAYVIKEMIKTQENDYNWDFVFLGANIDSKTTAVNLGINYDNAMNFAPNSRGVRSAYQSVSENLTSVRRYDKADMRYENKDYTSQVNAGVTN